MEAGIVIAVMVLMIIGFVLNKWSFGLITMSCCLILGVTGVLGPAETFSGLSNPFVVMLAGSFVVTNALGKTSFIKKVQKQIIKMQNGKSGAMLMAIFVGAVILLATFMPGPSLLAILIVMAKNLNDEGEVNAARVIMPAAALTTLWNGRIPLGIGAGNFAILNGFLEPYGVDYTVNMFDPLKAGLVPGILIALFTVFGYKLLPHKSVSRLAPESDTNGSKELAEMSKRDETITYITFIVMLVVMIFNKYTGSLLFLGPAVCAVFLVFAKVITVEDVKKGITVDLIFMLAGIFTLTNALSITGAGELIGRAILSVFGGATTEFGLIALFGGITIIITNFMSNTASMYAMIPVAITTSLAAGVNPIPVMLAIDVASKCACLLPCSSGEAAMCYGASEYTLKDTIKFTIPTIIIYYIGTVAGIYLLY